MNISDSGISINGNLYVIGDIINAELLEMDITTMQLKTKVTLLEMELSSYKRQIKELQEQMTEVWYAPNMPGYLKANERYTNQITNNNKK